MRAIPPTSANGTFNRISTACDAEPNAANSKPKMISNRYRQDDHEALARTLLILELAAPVNVIARQES